MFPESSNQKIKIILDIICPSLTCPLPGDGLAHAVTALLGQESNQFVHERKVRRATEHTTLPFLVEQAGIHEMRYMMREGRGRNAQMVLDLPHRQPFRARADQEPKDLQTDRVPQLVQTICGMIEFHEANVGAKDNSINDISRIIETNVINGRPTD